MQTLQYLYDESGTPTAMYVDLRNSQMDNIFKKPLNKSQIEILKLVGNGFSDGDLNEFRRILANYLITKVRRSANKAWDEKKHTKETFEKFVEND